MSNVYALVIAGPRDLAVDDTIIEKAIGDTGWKPYIIISGGARGIDTCAYYYAKRAGYFPVTIPARWDYWKQHGNMRFAGTERNRVQAYLGDALLVIKRKGINTPGTTSMYKIAKQKNLPVHVHNVDVWHGEDA